MRDVLRSTLVAFLAAALMAAPVSATPSAVLGIVLQSDHARLSAGEALSGATIFDGDTVTTDSSGTMRIRLGGSRLFLLASSSTSLQRTSDGIRAVLRQGSVVLSSPADPGIELQASDVRIRPKVGQPALMQVTLVSPEELLVTSRRGELELSIGGEEHIIPAETSYRVLIAAGEQGPQGNGAGRPPVRVARNRLLPVILLGVAAATAIIVWRATVSPDQP